MSRKDVLLESLLRFFSVKENLDTFTEYTGRDSPLSLRLLDWLVTNYSKKHNVVYMINKGGEERTFNMFMDYKSQLKAYSKRFFDPFCRRERINIVNGDGQEQSTTTAQLCFFRWAIQNDVLSYAQQYKDNIESDMLCVSKVRSSSDADKAKRHELSMAAIKSCTKTFCHVTVRFK